MNLIATYKGLSTPKKVAAVAAALLLIAGIAWGVWRLFFYKPCPCGCGGACGGNGDQAPVAPGTDAAPTDRDLILTLDDDARQQSDGASQGPADGGMVIGWLRKDINRRIPALNAALSNPTAVLQPTITPEAVARAREALANPGGMGVKITRLGKFAQIPTTRLSLELDPQTQGLLYVFTGSIDPAVAYKVLNP